MAIGRTLVSCVLLHPWRNFGLLSLTQGTIVAPYDCVRRRVSDCGRRMVLWRPERMMHSMPNHRVDPTASGLVAPRLRLSPAVDHARRSA
jgi:hypothetical protein